MFATLLVAVDHSDAAQRATLEARDLAVATGAKVVVVHAEEHLPPAGRMMSAPIEEPGEAAATLATAEKVLRDAGVAVTTALASAETGRVAQELLDQAERFGADLIIMGSHAPNAVGHLMLGSTAYKVLHLSHRPVLITR